MCDFSYAPFATPGGRREHRGGKTDDERELSTLIRQTLESSVQVGIVFFLEVVGGFGLIDGPHRAGLLGRLCANRLYFSLF